MAVINPAQAAAMFGGIPGVAGDPHALTIPGGVTQVIDVHPETGYFQDAAKTVPAASGDPVYTWVEAIGGYDYIQATGANQPLVSPTVEFGTYRGVICDNVNDYLRQTSKGASNPFAMFAVVKFSTLGAAAECVYSAISGDSLCFAYSNAFSGNGRARYYLVTASPSLALDMTLNTVYVLGTISNGASSYWLDIDKSWTALSASAPTTTASTLMIRENGTGSPLAGQIARFTQIDGLINTTEAGVIVDELYALYS